MIPVLEVSRLTRRFGDLVAVSDLSFRVEAPATIGLLGANGAGKTTALRLLAGYLVPHGGTARIAGHDLLAEPREVRRRIGYLAEGAPAHGDARVEPYLRFRARLKGLGRRAHAEASRAIERCGLTGERRTLIAHLSRGYRQRVGLADALLGAPPLLLLDEPTSGLDPTQVREVRALLREIGAERTVVLSSNALGEIEALCGRVLVLDHGRLVADAEAGALRRGTGRARLAVTVRGSEVAARAALAAVAGLGALETTAGPGDLVTAVAEVTAGDPRADAARALCAAGLDLLELGTKAPSLEDAFVGLVARAP